MNKQYYSDQATHFFQNGYSCSQAVFMAFSPALGLDQELAQSISLPFGGGMGVGQTCGALTGGFMALGLGIESSTPPMPEEKIASKLRLQEIVATIEEEYGSSFCDSLLTNWEVEKQAVCTKKEYCTSLVTRSVELVYDHLFTKK